jgi:hypothetical protein
MAILRHTLYDRITVPVPVLVRVYPYETICNTGTYQYSVLHRKRPKPARHKIGKGTESPKKTAARSLCSVCLRFGLHNNNCCFPICTQRGGSTRTLLPLVD